MLFICSLQIELSLYAPLDSLCILIFITGSQINHHNIFYVGSVMLYILESQLLIKVCIVISVSHIDILTAHIIIRLSFFSGLQYSIS